MKTYNRLDILSSLLNTFSGISEKVYLTDRPASSSQLDSYLVIKMGNVEPLHAYGDSYVTIKIFQRDGDDGEATYLLSKMEQDIYNLLPIDNDLFKTGRPKSLDSRYDGVSFHYLPIYFNLILK